jgi:hypothetical protein
MTCTEGWGIIMRDKRFPGFPYATVGKFLIWSVILIAGLIVPFLLFPVGGILGGHVSNNELALGILAILLIVMANQTRKSE